MQSEIKEKAQGNNSDRKETETQINGLDKKEEISIQAEKNEESRIQKNEERLRNLQNNFKCSNIQIIGVPEEEEEQEIENLFEKIMKENFPNLAKKKNRLLGSSGSSESPKEFGPKEAHTEITLPKIKDKERILKAARQKERVTYKGVPIRLSADFSK